MAKEEELGTFEGHPVERVKIIVTKTGDGLSEAMEVEPHILTQGDTGFVVLAFKTSKIRFDLTKRKGEDEDEGPITVDRIQILEATGATFVDRDLVGDVVDKMRQRIAELRAEEARRKAEERGEFSFDSLEGPEDDDKDPEDDDESSDDPLDDEPF